MRRFAAVVLVLSATGCFPAVIHGPRVDQGWGVGLSAATTSGPTYVEGDEGGVHLRQGQIGAHIGHGWAPSSPKSPGLYLGLAVPALFPLVQADIYVQAPPASLPDNFAAGVGVNQSSDHSAAYVQFGHINPDGEGWFLTEAFSVRYGGPGRNRAEALVTGAAIQATNGRIRSYFFAQHAIGRNPYDTQMHSLALGFVFELRRRPKAGKQE